ncbi:MAG: hypothetical protein ASARMPREDX12_003839 [Alectoria sarmentosa]|nr:MAG: hypothetical protein ASARMPREDX12_003839 [Alectoria sarmentosa]
MPSTEISPPPLKRRRISELHPPRIHPPSPPIPSSPPPLSAHDPPSTSTADSLRIYSWNINGIRPFLPPSTPPITTFLKPAPASTASSKPAPLGPSLRENLKRWKWPHVLCLQEVKIAPTDIKTQSSLRRVVNAPLDSDDENDSERHLYDAHFCLPRDKYNDIGFGGKVYGVCTLLRRDVVPAPATRTVEWDREGRVLLAEMSKWGVVVVNVYAVNGTTNDHRDPATGKVVGDRHGRKRIFHSLLRDEVRRYEDKGWDVVVAGDMNISRSFIDSFPQLRTGEEHVRNRADFEEKFIKDLGMVDTFRAVHGGQRKFTYRPRNKPWGAGGDRVDLILVTKGLEEKGGVRGADVWDREEERGSSDHVPLFVEVGIADG